MSMARGMPGPATLELAARAIAIGVAANTAMKLTLALVFSVGSFRRIAGGTLAAMLCAAVAGSPVSTGNIPHSAKFSPLITV